MKPALIILMFALTAQAQLAVTVLPVKVTGQKAIVPLTLKNNFAEKVESAKAVVFLLDEQGKMVGQSTRWVIGGTKDQSALESKSEAKFNFVIPTTKPLISTNLSVKIAFSRLVLEGGKLADATKNVQIQNAK